jgi:hypothetical protein
MKQDNEDHVFFWDEKRIRTFYAYEMPTVWFKPAFLGSFQDSLSALAMPWTTLWEGHKLKDAMDKYRKINGIAPYKTMDINDFLRFISGLYTHEIELKVVDLRICINMCIYIRNEQFNLEFLLL